MKDEENAKDTWGQQARTTESLAPGDRVYMDVLCRCGQQPGTRILGTCPEIFIFMARIGP